MYKRRIITAVIFSALLVVLSANAKDKLYFIAPTEIPHVTREMKTPGFWIGRVAKPDAPIMDAKAIANFNRRVREELRSAKDLLMFSDPYPGEKLKEDLVNRLTELQTKNYYNDFGQKVAPAFFEHMRQLMALEAIGETLPVGYGFIVRYADQRFLPTEDGLYATAHDIDFDELQNSALDVATPVIVLHRSADQKWAYVAGELSDGWVKAAKIALFERAAWKDYLTAKTFAVVTEAKADLYLDEARTRFYDHVRMGVKLPLAAPGNGHVHAVRLPMKNADGTAAFTTVYLEKDSASLGYLPYTPRMVINQAFKMLNEPYGWGGMYGEQDCSRLLQEVFTTVGILLPRDSKDQARVGQSLAAFEENAPFVEKLAALKAAPVGSTVLPMKGHIMLYLGMVDGRPYAIHSVWGYRERSGEEDVVRVINRTTVSDLYLGEGSNKGSLLKRLNAVRTIVNTIP